MLRELCKQHFIDIILLLRESPKSFNELQKLLNAYPDTLNRRLKELTEMGIIVQVKEDRVRYKLTEKGVKISKILKEILENLREIESIVK